MIFQCPICRLRYHEKEWAEKCREWCSRHDSCNLEVARHSVEAGKSRNKSVE